MLLIPHRNKIQHMAIVNRTKESAALVEAFGRVVAELREARGLTQRELAAMLEVDTSMVGKVENGTHLPRIEQWLAMARILRTTPHEMLRAAEDLAGGKRLSPLIALDSEQAALLAAFVACNPEGKRLVLDYARTTAKVFKPRVR